MVVDERAASIDVGGRQPRTVLAALLGADGRPVSVDLLVDSIWGEHLPASATGTLQSYVSRLRRALGPGAELVHDASGYRLVVADDEVDVRRFRALADEGRALLGAERWAEARQRLLEADALWRGPVATELSDLEPFLAVVSGLDERRVQAQEDAATAGLALGQPQQVASELAGPVAANPLHEGLQELLALALYRSGRQADALRTLAVAASTLRDELGLEPSRRLRDLETAILEHDPALDGPASVDAGPGALTGPPDPVGDPTVASIASGAAAPPRRTPGAGRLVGRDDELVQLLDAFAESATGSRIVVVEGEPGIGKTRLVDELRAAATDAGALVAWGRADEGGAAPALWPWLPPLRAVAEHHPVPAAVAELLSGTAAMSGQAQTAIFERFEAVADLFDAAARDQPVVVLLDDLQWADATSLDLLAHLAARPGVGVLVVGTLRQLEVGRNDAVTAALAAVARSPGNRRVQLKGLGAAATASLLEDVGDQEVTTALVDAIHARAEGNPFYAIQLARLAGEEGVTATAVPGGVSDVIRRRLARLPDDTAELVPVAAVVGRDVDLDVLGRAAGLSLDEVLDTIDAAVVQRLLVEVPDQPGALRFNHALVREVVLEDLSALRRARLHLRVADALEARGVSVDEVEILAEHLWQAAPVGVQARAADALEAAAEVALRRIAYPAAEDLLRRAVQLRRASGAPDSEAAEMRATYRLLDVARALRYYSGAADHRLMARAKELAERQGDRVGHLTLIWFEWSSLATSAQLDAAERLAADFSVLVADEPDVVLRAGGEEIHGVLAWQQGRIGDACRHLDRAMATLADAPPPEDPFLAEQAMVSHLFWVFNHVARGDLDWAEGRVRLDQVLEQAPDRPAAASICGFAGTTALVNADWDAVDRYSRAGMDADPAAHFSFWAGQARMLQGMVLTRAGQVEAGLALFGEGRDRYTGVQGRSGLPAYEASLAWAAVESGELDLADVHLTAARTDLDSHHEQWGRTQIEVAQAQLHAARGELDDARRTFSAAVELATRQEALGLAAVVRRVAGELGLDLDA